MAGCPWLSAGRRLRSRVKKDGALIAAVVEARALLLGPLGRKHTLWRDTLAFHAPPPQPELR